MKYFSLSSVVNAYINFQNTMTNKSWGYLSLIKGCKSKIKPCTPFEVDLDCVSNFLESIFNLSSEKKIYDSSKMWYVVFSNQWDCFFSTQGRNIPNIYDIAVWAYRRKAFNDDTTIKDVLSLFINEFNLPSEMINSIFTTNSTSIDFTDSIYDEKTLKNELSKHGVNVSTNNIDAKKSAVIANPGEISRGPFVQTLYAGLEISDYILITQSNYLNLYSFNSRMTKYLFSDLQPLQQIFYGAPGTGKSNTIKREVEGKGKIHFRTTFHPDSDYSTFVGCYKPTMVEAPVRDGSGHEVKDAKQEEKSRISYSFVPQAFLKAYCEAWNKLGEGNNEPVYLIIEEINRGNCAQIFGDLFQLLDRKDDGYSDYPIDADEDLKRFLKQGVKEDGTKWLINENGIKNGELCLPPNLYIWATMNTSDQSLFPIDSAFKRRWEWKYMPISDAGENWEISVNGVKYDWWSFVEKINEKIDSVTHSEDKKLGYFFCKAENKIISAEKFVGKVLFYIYNDVFKDYGFDDSVFKNANDNDSVLTFQSFFMPDGTPNEEKVAVFMTNLGVR